MRGNFVYRFIPIIGTCLFYFSVPESALKSFIAVLLYFILNILVSGVFVSYSHFYGSNAGVRSEVKGLFFCLLILMSISYGYLAFFLYVHSNPIPVNSLMVQVMFFMWIISTLTIQYLIKNAVESRSEWFRESFINLTLSQLFLFVFWNKYESALR